MTERGVGLIGALLEQRYRVDALLARGGMSSVYRGLDTRLDRRVAIKVMDERFAADRSFVERFEREARSAAKVHHPNVVAVHDQGVDRGPGGDLVYLVMELVDGGTLRDLVSARGALDVPLALAIVEPVLSALAAAHRVGLVHRDVKPENVLIGHSGEHGTTVKVGDFGLVRAVSSAGTTSSSIILGTVAYLSPEQVTTGNATARGDVYSAGILLYEMLTGVAPYTGDNPISVAYRHVNDDVPAPSRTVPGLPPALDELVVRATRRDPAARPADGTAFLAELTHLRAQLAVPRVGIPVPEPTLADRTVPVTPVELERARAWTPPPGDSPRSGELDLAELTQPAAPVVTRQTPPTPTPTGAGSGAGVGNATIVRQVPAGFQAAGPQGTRAMLRTDLDRVAQQPEQGPPSVGVPPMPPPPPRRRPAGPPPRGGRRGGGTVVLWSLAAFLVVAIVAATTWWFVDGRWSTVPEVAGTHNTEAQEVLRENDLQPRIEYRADNEIESGITIRTDPAGGTEVLRGEPVTLVVSSGRPKVPDVRPGSTVEEAKQLIREAQLQPGLDTGINEYSDEVEQGRVIRLEPASGNEVRVKQRIEIVVSKGPAPKPVPDLRGKTREEAFAELEDLGLSPVEGGEEFDPGVDGGAVIRTEPAAGTTLEAGTEVRVFVSNAVTVPDLNGRSAQDATTVLAQLGLPINVQAFGGTGRVFGQNPPAGSRVQAGTTITVFTIP
ncbi:MAG TPA: PASTA domain-containing protein [Actinophytocola sp.]|nr:PASTA domain-containing protein [Actinophytocola sp.]